MTRGLPRFMPILTSFAGRVAGRAPEELLGSGAVLARALSDARKVVGHDGVLCLYEPSLLAAACLNLSGGIRLRSPDEVAATPSFQVVLEAVHGLAGSASAKDSVFFTLAGPALLHRELLARCPSAPELRDYDYVADVFTSALRAALESRADGVALIESFDAVVDEDLRAMHRSARKLADFYERLLVLYQTPDSAPVEIEGPHCSFALPATCEPCTLVRAQCFDTDRASAPPMTTAGDVPADTPVAVLRGLCAQAMGQDTGGPETRPISTPGST